MQVRRLLVGTDLTERSAPAVVKGHELAHANGARLVVCHVAPATTGSNPLFPQRHEDDVLSLAHLEREVADAVSNQVTELTGRTPDDFDVIVDQGDDRAAALAEQAVRTSADLIVVAGDQGENLDGVVGQCVALELARRSSCSILVTGESGGKGAVVAVLEDEIEAVPELVASSLGVLGATSAKTDAVVWVSDKNARASALADRVAAEVARTGQAVETWFADLDDTSILGRAAVDPSVGIVAVSAPLPSAFVRGTAGPLDDILPEARCSILLLRSAHVS
ncbi:MAG TPA: universal stress protein [Polyangiaceae bacterium]|nr:universal stress protein [Polyangiaceae bacterium]